MHSQTWAPSRSAKVVRYRYGWGFLAGALFLCAFDGLFVYYALEPEAAAEGHHPVVGWVFAAIFAPFALIMLLGGLFMLSRGHQVRVDERGLWLRSGGDTDLVAWSELRAVRGQEPRPKAQDDPNSEALPAALVFHPADRAFGVRHAVLLKSPNPPEAQLELPGKATVQRLVRVMSEVRPDLVR
ncbi:hypothetical protein ABT324_18460 [Saccharopolyspora sp. NPDC000359]|uniref:hypothetical protein n=1 Tax=Saccharopolyspora sp. NPDC000359 TaxID=3154251 RepID=UPI00332919D4